MGMQIGWNAQIMPLNIVEFDLFEIGDCVIIGEQVMMVARDANGLMKKCRIGNDSAITTSAIMLAGSHVGNHCLVGNLTVLPPDFQVPDVSKCIGTKYMLGFHQPPVIVANTEEERQPSWQSNLTMTMHCALALLWDVVEMPGMILLSYILVQIQNQVPSIQNESHLFVIPLGIPGAYLIVNLIIAFLCTSTSLVLIVVKRFSCGFFGSYNRGSPISVFFIFMTKLQMNQQMWTQIINGTPWQSLNYNNWGADIACSARLFMRSFADVTGLRVCANSVLDYDCCLEQVNSPIAFRLHLPF